MYSSKFIIGLTFMAGCATQERETEHRAVSIQAIVSQPGKTAPLLPEGKRDTWLSQTADTKLAPELRARAYLALGEAKNAQELIRGALEKSPGQPSLLKMIAVSYAMGKNFAMAGYYADLVLEKESADPLALNLRGLAQLFRSTSKLTLEKTAETLKTAHSDGGVNQIAASLNYGELLLQLGRPAEALEIFIVARSRCGECDQALYGEGVAAARSGQTDRAMNALRDLIRQSPDHFRGRYQLAIVYKNGKKDLKESRTILEGILADPKLKDDALRQRANATLRGMNAEDAR